VIRPISALSGLLGLLGLLVAAPPARAAEGRTERVIEVRPGESGRLEVTNEGTRSVRRSRPAPPPSSAVHADRRAHASRRLPPRELSELIHSAALANDLDPALVEAVIQAESAWNVRAVSRKGALGLMQIMPATARDLSLDQPFDAAENIRAGTEYLRRMLDLFDGDEVLALAAYNAGPTTVSTYGGVPPYRETVSYVRRVLRLWRGDDAPVVVPVAAPRLASSPRRPARPVRWTSSSGGRLHLTNVQ
jgi:soluble lytic murein transglycosylase-like protein